MVKKVDRKKFVRYKEGAEIYSMGFTERGNPTQG